MIVPRFSQERCVILSDGGVESLVACAMASEQQQLTGGEPSVVLPGWWEWAQEIDLMISAVDPAVMQQSKVYGLQSFGNQAVFPPEHVGEQASADLAQQDATPLSGATQSQILLEVASIALRAGIRKIVWPIRVIRPESGDLSAEMCVDQISKTVDRAVLVSRLASLDANESGAVDVVIETPFVDLTNQQMRDLAIDLAVPMESCWWHDGRNLPHGEGRWGFWMHRAATQIEARPNPRVESSL